MVFSVVAGFEEEDTSTITARDTSEKEGATAAVNYSTGPIQSWFQKKVVNQGELATGNDDYRIFRYYHWFSLRNQ